MDNGIRFVLSLTKKFIFIHVHKTGGNSIQSALQIYSEDRIEKLSHSHETQDFEVKNSNFPSLKKHSTLRDYQKVLDERTFKGLYKFACVRNPWERMISFYFSPHRGVTDWSRDSFIELVESIGPTMSFLTTRDWASQKSLGVKPEVDFIIRFENLQDDFDQVCERIGISKIILPHKNRSNRRNYLDYYDADLIRLVEKRFANDIQYFGYTNCP